MLPDLWLLICTHMVGSYPEDRPYKTYMMAEIIWQSVILSRLEDGFAQNEHYLM